VSITPKPKIVDVAALKERVVAVAVQLVDVPEWEGSVGVREMTARQRDEWEASVYQTNAGKRGAVNSSMNRKDFRATLLVRCLSDEKGALLFAADEIEFLSLQPAGVISRLFDVAMKINGITKDDADALGESEDDDPFPGQA
jgi:hypothetical protein